MANEELLAFPGERPIPSEKEKWFKEAQRVADTSEVGFLLRGETPPSLQKYALPRDMTGLAPIGVPDNATPETRLSALKFSMKQSNESRMKKTSKRKHSTKVSSNFNDYGQLLSPRL